VDDELRIIEVNNSCYLDVDSHTLAIQLGRVTFSINVEEFLEFYLQVDEINNFLKACPLYTVGHTMDAEKKEMFVPKPEDDEYN
jgi:hypothetical protein